MRRFLKIKNILAGATLAFALLVSTVSIAQAAPSPENKRGQTPPSSGVASGAEAKPEVEPGTVDAKETKKLGPTEEAKIDKNQLKTNSAAPLAGNVAGVDFDNFLNYCYKGLSYPKVKNTTSTTKYAQVRIYNQGTYHEKYITLGPGTTSYPAFYGIEGNYNAYLYVWNGSSYAYDEYKAGNNTCKVDVGRVYNTGGWVQLKMQNTGTANATQKSTELAPYPGSGTYTGTQYNYPVPGGAAIYRWFYVGTSPYGIVSETVGSSNSPYLFYGDL